jgi:deoxyadenosine/deoxycytidine kinase
MKYQYISVEGNIGVGKTTFVNMLSPYFDCKLVLEQFEDNPFLKKFYQHPERYGLSLELFFMAERFQQLSESISPELFSPLVISDYFFLKSKFFAKNNLSNEELILFNRFADIALNNLAPPQLLVYLHSSVDRLQENISYRNRSYEQAITDEYLLNIQNIYFDFFKKERSFPILILDVENVDFVKDQIAFNKMKDLFQQNYSNGVHRFKI